MAQKQSFNLIIVGVALFLLMGGGSFAAVSKSEAKKYPPITGEIYGQAVPGVRTITVNNKPVPFDKDFNFKTTVNLKAGEKYITLKINYAGLRIVKRYLIVRKGPVKKFEVHVPKEKIRKPVAAAKPAEKPVEVSLPTEQVTPAETLVQVTTPEEIPVTTIKPAPTTLPLKAAAPEEKYEIKKVLEKEREIMPLPEEAKEVKIAAKPAKRVFQPIKRPARPAKKKKIKIKKIAMRIRPKPPAPRPAVAKRKPCDYRYVWEFSRGKMMLVKEQKGVYSAQIHVSSSKQWVELKDLSSKDLKELMAK